MTSFQAGAEDGPGGKTWSGRLSREMNGFPDALSSSPRKADVQRECPLPLGQSWGMGVGVLQFLHQAGFNSDTAIDTRRCEELLFVP